MVFSIKAITRKLGISRNTVRSYIRKYDQTLKQIEASKDTFEIIRLQKELVSKPIKKTTAKRRVFTGRLKQRFYELMKQSEEKDVALGINKQRVTAALLLRRLRSEGFTIGRTTVQLEFKRYMNKRKEVFIKQSYQPGLRAEYDFHEVKVIIDGKKRKLQQATITLPFSNYKFVKYYENQRLESFIDSLVSFFETVAGVPETIVFDNMRNVVRRFVYRGEKRIYRRSA